jgi:uncharacterized protein (TIGR02147 family)
MLQRAQASMDLVPASARDITSLTFCLPEDGIETLKARLAELRRELIEYAESKHDRRRVVQLNLQLFPLSQPLPKKPKGKSND